MYEVALPLYQSFLHFYHLDCSNAAIHNAPVRFSPLTFRLAEALADNTHGVYMVLVNEGWDERQLHAVMVDKGKYAEDVGR